MACTKLKLAFVGRSVIFYAMKLSCVCLSCSTDGDEFGWPVGASRGRLPGT